MCGQVLISVQVKSGLLCRGKTITKEVSLPTGFVLQGFAVHEDPVTDELTIDIRKTRLEYLATYSMPSIIESVTIEKVYMQQVKSIEVLPR